jgi:hypothetical protein
MKSKYLIQVSSSNDALSIKNYYTLSGAQTLNEANKILNEFIEISNYSQLKKSAPSIYNKNFRVIKQKDWQAIIRENNHKLFNERI